jgi:hypothetical protein
MEENERLNQTLLQRGITPAPPVSRLASQQNSYCMTNSCYTPTEFALYGICIFIGSIFVAIFLVRLSLIIAFLIRERLVHIEVISLLQEGSQISIHTKINSL